MAQLAQLTTAEYTQRFNDQVSAGANAAAQSMEKLANAFEVTEQRAKRTEGSFASLEARLDAGARLSQARARADEQLARQIDAINAAVARGAITQERANQLTELATQRQAVYVSQVQRQIAIEEQRNRALLAGNAAAVNGTAATNAFASANDNARQSSGRFGQIMGQAGFQVQDFATQVSMGQNALLAFGVQFAQFAGFLGTGGALAGAAVMVGLIGANLLMAGDTAAEQTRRMESNFDGMKKAAEEVATVIREINDLFLTASERSAAAANRQTAELTSNAERLLNATIQRNESNAMDLVQAQRELAQQEARIAARDAEIRARTGSRANDFQRQDAATLFPLRERIAGLEADIYRSNQRIGELNEALARARNAGVNTGEEYNMPPAPNTRQEERDAAAAAREAERQRREAEREHQRVIQQGVSLAESVSTEAEKYEAQLVALTAALDAGRVSQEQYNRAVAQLNPAFREARQAEERALQERERLNKQVTDDIVRYSADSFADLWSNTGRGFAGLMENMLQIVRRTFARIAAEAVIRPIVTPIVSNFVTPLLNSFGLGGGGATAGAAGQASPGLFSGAINFSGLAGLAGLANFGGLPGIGGLGGIGSGISNFLNLPLFGSAAQASATNGALAALGPGVYGPATPASVGLAGTTVGGFLGAAGLGAGLGFAGGSITGALRGTADPLPGVLIGTGLGFVLGGPIGAGIGGAIGGLFGPTVKGNASRAGGDVFLGTDANGRLIITSARGKRWDQAGATAEVQSQLDAINAQIAPRGLTFAAPGQAAVGFGQASGSPRELSLTALVGQLRSDNANQMTAFGTLAGRGGNLEEALQAADFVTQVFEPLSEAEKKTGTFTAAMEALTKTYDDAIKKAKDLGLSEAGLQAQRAERAAKLEADRARDLSIIDRTLGARRATLAGDTRGASLTQFDLRAEEENRAFREQLRNLGFDEAGQDFARRMVELEQIVADERLAVMRQFDDQMRGISQGLLEQLTLGDLGGLAPEARFGAGLSLLNNAQAALADGATVQELAEFSRVAQNVLPIAKDFLGISSNYAELVADVSRTLRTAAPGSDPANLGAILEASLNGSDRVEMAILSTGQSQTTVLQTLLTELKRLTAQNEALLARAAA